MRCGVAWQVRPGTARRSRARCREARQARRGEVPSGEEWLGAAGMVCLCTSRSGEVRCGRQGAARNGVAGQAWRGEVPRGKVWLGRYGRIGPGTAWRGAARIGEVWYGRSGGSR